MMQPQRDFWAGKRVCVTGGTGFLGYHLVLQLRKLDAQVTVFSLAPSSGHPILNEPDIDKVFGDLCNPQEVSRAVAGCDVIFHTAGIVAVWGSALKRMYSVHVEGTKNVIDAAKADARIVHTSSIVAVGGGDRQEVFSEESAFNLENVRVDYIHAKREAERVALDATRSGRDVVVVNPGYLIGPEDHERSVMGRFCVRLLERTNAGRADRRHQCRRCARCGQGSSVGCGAWSIGSATFWAAKITR